MISQAFRLIKSVRVKLIIVHSSVIKELFLSYLFTYITLKTHFQALGYIFILDLTKKETENKLGSKTTQLPN